MNNEMTTDNMSNEEIIDVLKGIVFNGFDRTTRKERQALDLAIKALEERTQDCSDCKRYDSPYFEIKFDKEQMQELVNKAKAEVLASIERSQSEWVGNAFNEHHCKRCGHPALWEEEPDDYYEVQSNFCPECGADMRKGGEEE